MIESLENANNYCKRGLNQYFHNGWQLTRHTIIQFHHDVRVDLLKSINCGYNDEPYNSICTLGDRVGSLIRVRLSDFVQTEYWNRN